MINKQKKSILQGVMASSRVAMTSLMLLYMFLEKVSFDVAEVTFQVLQSYDKLSCSQVSQQLLQTLLLV